MASVIDESESFSANLTPLKFHSKKIDAPQRKRILSKGNYNI